MNFCTRARACGPRASGPSGLPPGPSQASVPAAVVLGESGSAVLRLGENRTLLSAPWVARPRAGAAHPFHCVQRPTGRVEGDFPSTRWRTLGCFQINLPGALLYVAFAEHTHVFCGRSAGLVLPLLDRRLASMGPPPQLTLPLVPGVPRGLHVLSAVSTRSLWACLVVKMVCVETQIVSQQLDEFC